jgi:hypothetical protein
VTPALVVGPLQAYRYWYAKWDCGQPVLQSIYHATPWPVEGPLQARCEKTPSVFSAWVRRLLSRRPKAHPAPTWACECGVYALSRLDGDGDLDLSVQVNRGVHVAGEVLLWGRVIRHEHGYRAEYARPLKLMTVPSALRDRYIGHLLAAAAERYAIQLITRTERVI